MYYNVVSSHPMHPRIDGDVLPTPRLISEGTARPVEAYAAGEYRGQTLWRIRDEASDAEGQTYQRVMIEVCEGESEGYFGRDYGMASDGDLTFWGERGDTWAAYVLRDRELSGRGRITHTTRRLSLTDERTVQL